MIKYLISLPDGSEISSGPGTTNAIMNVSHTEITNDQTDLSLGSVCSSFVEISLITPGSGLNIAAGSEITLYRMDGASKTKVGLFTAEKPTRVKANRYKITAYDRVSWLDKDLTDWLSNLSGWPYTLGSFAKMVCDACGVPLATASFPNSGFYTNRPSLSGGITGRQLMKWIAEIAGRFCVANADGELEFRWYQQSGVVIAPSGDSFFYSGSLSYEDYQVSQIDAVKVRLADSDSGALWPEGEAENPYVVKGNRLLQSNITEGVRSVLATILQEVSEVQYTPCKVTIPATAGVHAGQIVEIVDSNGNRFSTYVMKAVHSGQKARLESTGNAKRNSSEALNFLSNQDLKDYANSAAAGAVQAQTQEDVFKKLTNGGLESGIYLKDGILYINANFIQSGFLSADIIRAGQIRSTDFEVEELQEIYPAADLYPSAKTYPNNGEQIIRGFEIDFASGVIRGVFWSDSIAALEDRVLALENQQELSEETISRLEKENGDLQSTVINLETALSYTDAAVDSLQASNAELQAKVSELENEVAVQQGDISDLEAQITALQIAGQELDSRLTKLETSLVYPKSAT